MIALALGASALAAADWQVLQEDQVRVRCRPVDTGTECEAEATLAVPAAEVRDVLDDPAGWPDVFATVQTATELGSGQWAIQVDLPFPLTTWELVATLHHRIDGARHLYELERTDGTRGLWSEADWIVVAEGTGTRVLYRWVSEDLPLPESLRRSVRRRTGHNTVWGVAIATATQPVGAR